jgi:hypothetical protein
MEKADRVGDLEVHQNLPYQQRMWKLQRVGWGLMGLVVWLAFLGLFGKGWLSSSSITNSEGNLRVDYERFLRHQAKSEITVHVRPGKGQQVIHLGLNKDYLQSIEVMNIVPQPEKTELRQDGLTFIFPVQSLDQFEKIHFFILPKNAGTAQAQLRLENQDPLVFSQFVYP